MHTCSFPNLQQLFCRGRVLEGQAQHYYNTCTCIGSQHCLLSYSFQPMGGSLGSMFKKPSGGWECDACMVQNKSDAEKCVACETPRPGSKPAAAASAAPIGITPIKVRSNTFTANKSKVMTGSLCTAITFDFDNTMKETTWHHRPYPIRIYYRGSQNINKQACLSTLVLMH